MSSSLPSDDPLRSPREALVDAIGTHPLRHVVDQLDIHVHVGCDAVTLSTFLILAAAHINQPLNLIISSDNTGADRVLTDKVVGLSSEEIAHVDNIGQFRTLANQGFQGFRAVLIRDLHPTLYRFALGCQCVAPTGAIWQPSIFLLTDEALRHPCIGPTLPLRPDWDDRTYTGFGHCFAAPRESQVVDSLRRILEWLELTPPIHCSFERRITASMRPDEMVVVNRLMNTVAAIRGYLRNIVEDQLLVMIEDYAVTRALLQLLPVMSVHDGLSPHAAESANTIYQAVCDPHHQLTVPDRSAEGRKLFTVSQAQAWTALSYNGVKKHINQLEDSGILTSSVMRANRRQGKQIFYRFCEGGRPPFGRINPYLQLPTPEDIERDLTS